MKKITLFRCIIGFAFLSIHIFASAQTLWSGTEYGMSLAEVIKVVPNAIPPSTKPSHLYGGAAGLLSVENLQIVNQRFNATFFFLDDKLTQITLSLEKGHSYSEALMIMNSLTEVLRAKYGQEINRTQKDDAFSKHTDATWKAGKTNIILYASIYSGESAAMLNVIYQVRLANEGSKL